MYKIKTAGNKTIATVETLIDALIIAKQFSNAKCTFVKVYQGETLIKVFA
jgi:hypothetical protein